VTQIQPGWYPDPSSPQSHLRYWSGQAWTEHVHARQEHYAGPQQPYYAAQQLGPVGPTTPDGVPLSGWWRRVGAFLIDSLLVSTVVSILTLPLQLAMQSRMDDLMFRFDSETGPEAMPDFGAFFREYWEAMQPLFVWSAIATVLVWALYSSLMLRGKGATLGKMVAGIQVRLRDQPGQLPWSAIFARVFVQFGVGLTAVVPLVNLALSWFPLLDSLWPLWDKKRQALHDKAARTNVVRVR
jgi:uncharacterized RDD family membrane protein YckC